MLIVEPWLMEYLKDTEKPRVVSSLDFRFTDTKLKVLHLFLILLRKTELGGNKQLHSWCNGAETEWQ